MFSRLNRLLLKSGVRSNRWVSWFIAMSIALLTIVTQWFNPGLLQDVEGSLLDARFQLRGAVEPSGLVELVAIDEDSISEYGRWPWPREQLAELIESINDFGAYTIGLDIIFSEPEVSAVQRVIDMAEWPEDQSERLQTLAQSHNPDMVLATALFMSGNVVNGQFFFESEQPVFSEETETLLQSSAVAAVKSRDDSFRRLEFNSVRMNLPLIAQAGEGAGFFNQIPSRDGVVRNAPLVIKHNEQMYPSLALKTLSRYLDNAPIVVHADEFVIQRVTLGNDLSIPTNEIGALPLNYRGPKGTITTYSAVDIMEGRLPAGALQDKLILLGVTAIGVFDSHATPFGAEFPGLEIQANVVENMIMGDSLSRTDFHVLSDFLIIVLGCMLLAIVIPLTKRAPTRFLFYLMLISVLLYGNYWAFSEHQVWLNLLYPVVGWTFCFVLLLLYQSFMVEARYSHVRSAFKHYLSPDMVDQLTANPDLLNFGGEEREMSILFSDIRSFTNLSETVTPSELSRFLQAYMDPMTNCVLSNNGTLDKYIGDAVMALFGAPVPFKSHPVDACQAALDMIAGLDAIVDTVPDLKRLFPIRIGVGVHTGTVVVGNLGSSMHFNYTVIGDAVNLASRIEGLTKNYGVDVLISEVTYERVKDVFVCRDLDRVRVKGKQEPVGLLELIGREVDQATKSYLQNWHHAMELYRSRAFAEALTEFSACQQSRPGDVSAKVYIERCEHFIEEPVGEDWDGVFTHTSK